MDSQANAQRDAGPVVSSVITEPIRGETDATPVRILLQVVKRGVDVACASTLLIILVPLLLMVAVLVATDGGPIFFAHTRVGRGGRQFGCLKFRTMVPDAEHVLTEYLELHPEAALEWQTHQKLIFDPRVTTIGTALRMSSIDEIPQLINVIKGDMSLVGPRPVTMAELSRYGADAEHYKAVRPGITGLWQVSGRNALSYDRRIDLDIQYVTRWSLWLDFRILFRTPFVVFGREGAR